jgi:CheY-like chemotaxis protein
MPQPKILIVDDDENNRTVLCDVLGGESYTLLEAADGQHALDLALREMPDLILLDILMPGIDGIGVLHKLKEQEKTRLIPVMMVTALNLDSQISVCLDDGAVDYICKPFSSLVVRARVRAILRSRANAAAEKQSAIPQGKVLGFIGAKGGVGTTTVALNVALSLLKNKKTVVVVEMRSYVGTLAAQLGASAALNFAPLLQYANQGDINSRTIGKYLTNHPTGLKLLLAQPDMDDQREISTQQTEEIVKGLAGMFDYVILDIPSNPSKSSKAALRCCQFVTMVVELEATCLATAPILLKTLEAWGVGGTLVGAVLVHHIMDTSSMTVGFVRDRLSCPLIGVIPPAPDICAQALRSGSPLVVSQPDSLWSAALVELANRLVADHVSALVF